MGERAVRVKRLLPRLEVKRFTLFAADVRFRSVIVSQISAGCYR